MHADVDVDIFYNSKKPVIGYETDNSATTSRHSGNHSIVQACTVICGRYCWRLHMFTQAPVVVCRVILLIAFLFAMSMVLLNLLIALMSDAASKVSQQPSREALMHCWLCVLLSWNQSAHCCSTDSMPPC